MVAPPHSSSLFALTLVLIVMEVSAVAPSNTLSPIDVTLDGMVIEDSAVAPANALFPIDVTLAGITATPAHEFPPDTTPEVIVNVPLMLQFSVDVAPIACAGVEIKASSNSAEMSTVTTEFLRI